ncbi:MAG TPA: phosphatase PAP2 family protein [Noviherbaspirillum sp.]|nr:phosphatase PAP2 family protein [Noviherbaspirillum sp.]
MITWSGISHFGDITITAFTALAIAGWLVVEGEKRLALWWSLLFAGGLGIVIATKMAFIGWGIGIRTLDFTGFSGHAMRAMAVLPVLLYLILERAPRAVRITGTALGFAFGALVGVSRVAVHAHSVSEAVTGMALGAVVSICFLRIAGSSLRKHVFSPLRIVLSMVALLQAPYVHPAPTQQWLTSLTLYFSGREEPFPRAGWKEHRPQHEAPAS